MSATTDPRPTELPAAPVIHPAGRGTKLPLDAYFALVYPERAQEYLDSSPGNRNLREVRIDNLAQEMESKGWMLNGDSVVFDWHGRLLGGHHRLMACIKSGRPFPTVIVEGIDPKAKPTGGIGAPYSLVDNLTERGEKNVSWLAATLTRLVRFGRINEKEDNTSDFSGNSAYVSPAAALSYLKRNPELRDALSECAALRGVTSPSRVAWLYHLARQRDADRAQRFLDALATGANLSVDDPVYVLRARLTAEYADRKARLSEPEFQAILIKGWNAFAAGRRVKPRALAWQRTPSRAGTAPEPFPLPVF